MTFDKKSGKCIGSSEGSDVEIKFSSRFNNSLHIRRVTSRSIFKAVDLLKGWLIHNSTIPEQVQFRM